MIVIGSTVIRDISIASAKEVLFSSALKDHAKNTQTVSRNSMERWYMGHGKKPLNFGGNPDMCYSAFVTILRHQRHWHR